MKCLQTGGLRVEVGRHLYRTGFLRANGLQFCKGILHEDEEFTPRVLLQAQRVVLTGQEIYYYDNCRAGSITHAEGLSTRRVQDRLRIYDSLAEIYRTVTPRALRRRLQDDLCWKYLDCAARFDCRTLPATARSGCGCCSLPARPAAGPRQRCLPSRRSCSGG